MRSLVFATKNYGALASRIVMRNKGLLDGKLEVKYFPDGELHQRFESELRRNRVILVGGATLEEVFQLFSLGRAAQKYGAQEIIFVLPFYYGQTMERAELPGEVVTAKTVAAMLSAVPTAPDGNTALMLDLHAAGISHYFEGGIRTDHIYCKEIVLQMIREVGGQSYVLASVDDGRAPWVRSLANDLGVDFAFGKKERPQGGGKPRILDVMGYVRDQHVVIYDDMARTCGSAVEAARAYKDKGAKSLSLVVTHGVFPGDALPKLQQTELFDRVLCTDTHYHGDELAKENKFLQVRSVADIIAKELHKLLQ